MKKTLFSMMAVLAVFMLFTTTQSIASPLSAGIVQQEDYYLEDEQLYCVGEEEFDEIYESGYEDSEAELVLWQLYNDEDSEEELIAQLLYDEEDEYYYDIMTDDEDNFEDA